MTSHEMKITPNCPMIVYYGISVYAGIERNLSYIQSKLSESFRYNRKDVQQEQFGFFNLENLQETTFYFTNLR